MVCLSILHICVWNFTVLPDTCYSFNVCFSSMIDCSGLYSIVTRNFRLIGSPVSLHAPKLIRSNRASPFLVWSWYDHLFSV